MVFGSKGMDPSWELMLTGHYLSCLAIQIPANFDWLPQHGVYVISLLSISVYQCTFPRLKRSIHASLKESSRRNCFCSWDVLFSKHAGWPVTCIPFPGCSNSLVTKWSWYLSEVLSQKAQAPHVRAGPVLLCRTTRYVGTLEVVYEFKKTLLTKSCTVCPYKTDGWKKMGTPFVKCFLFKGKA